MIEGWSQFCWTRFFLSPMYLVWKCFLFCLFDLEIPQNCTILWWNLTIFVTITHWSYEFFPPKKWVCVEFRWMLYIELPRHYEGTSFLYIHLCRFSYLIVMSSSWNSPSLAEPSWKGSEPSQAELGYFHIRAETELTIINTRNQALRAWF